jgi:nicotinate-nucleotide pyrophosphorylase (carboxylating)
MDKKALEHIIREALAEDIQQGDITTNSIVSSESRSRAIIFAKEPAILCGGELACQVFRHLHPKVRCKLFVKEGGRIKPNKPVLSLDGSSRALLTGERTALNFLSFLSAIATKTNNFVQAVKPYNVKIMDTRKTTPTLRILERYAVRCGGGYNHRNDLSVMAMIKDNHWILSGHLSVNEMVDRIQSKKNVPVEIEVDNLNQFKQAVMSKVNFVLLDNMKPSMIREAVKLRNRLNQKILLEVSGGVNLKTVRQYAKTGVDRISIGGLTHSRNAIDFSMEMISK